MKKRCINTVNKQTQIQDGEMFITQIQHQEMLLSHTKTQIFLIENSCSGSPAKLSESYHPNLCCKTVRGKLKEDKKMTQQTNKKHLMLQRTIKTKRSFCA